MNAQAQIKSRRKIFSCFVVSCLTASFTICYSVPAVKKLYTFLFLITNRKIYSFFTWKGEIMDTIANPMGTKKVFPLLISMAVPPMISMMIQSLYNIVDSMFAARLGVNAITAISLAYPLQNLILSVGVGLGVGINACIAMSHGTWDTKKADQAAAHGLVLAGLHALVFIAAGLLGIRAYLGMFTKDPEVLSLSSQYTYIVVLLSAGSLVHVAIEKIFQAMGNMKVPMILQGMGALINIILDPLFIFGVGIFPKMGVAGAAIATVIGQWSACLLAVFLLFRKEHTVHIRFRGFAFDRELLKKIYMVAVPSAITMSLPSILISILNGILAGISEVGIAVLGIYFKVQTFIYMPSNGLIQGMRPIISFNYGAGRDDRVKETIRDSLLVTGGIMAAGTILFVVFPVQIMGLFHAGGTLLKMGIMAFRIISIGFLFSAVGVVFSGVFEALGKGSASLAVSTLRQFFIIPVLSLFLVSRMGVNGIWVSFPAAEAAAALAAVLLYRKYSNKR